MENTEKISVKRYSESRKGDRCAVWHVFAFDVDGITRFDGELKRKSIKENFDENQKETSDVLWPGFCVGA